MQSDYMEKEIVFRGGQSLNPQIINNQEVARCVKAQVQQTSAANYVRSDGFGASGVIRKWRKQTKE